VSSSIFLSIATLDSLEEVARELSLASGWLFESHEYKGVTSYQASVATPPEAASLSLHNDPASLNS
jgi:hypothetical protein